MLPGDQYMPTDFYWQKRKRERERELSTNFLYQKMIIGFVCVICFMFLAEMFSIGRLHLINFV